MQELRLVSASDSESRVSHDEIEGRTRSDVSKVHFLGRIPTCMPCHEKFLFFACLHAIVAHLAGRVNKHTQID